MDTALTAREAGSLAVIGERPIDHNPAAVYLAGLGERTRRTMRGDLDVIAGILSGGQETALTLPWAALRFQHTAAVRAQLTQRYAPATVNRQLSALRGVLKAAWRLEQVDAETYARAVDLEPVRGETLPTGRGLTAGEIGALFAVCAQDDTPAGARDAAILALLRLGLRRAEVAGLQLADLDLDVGTVKVLGKGRKERAVPVVGGALDALGDWLAIRGDDPGGLLLAVNKGGRVVPGGLTPQAVYNVLQKRAKQAHVKNVTPHDWRRSFVGDLLDAGADLSTVQRLAGHASPTTTSRYDRRPEQAKRRAAERLHVPYIGRRALVQGGLPGVGDVGS